MIDMMKTRHPIVNFMAGKTAVTVPGEPAGALEP